MTNKAYLQTVQIGRYIHQLGSELTHNILLFVLPIEVSVPVSYSGGRGFEYCSGY
jgi:hypothetical protein